MAVVPGDSKSKINQAMRDSLARTMRQSFKSRRYILFYGLLGLLCFVRTIESVPLDERSVSSRQDSKATLWSGLQTKTGHDEEVGNPSEIAYQAWLLIDEHPEAQQLEGLDSASLLRRIKPKSIFVAPNLTACPEGYQDDTMNRCVKEVSIDPQAHKGFIVQRLQAIFAAKSQAAAAAAAAAAASSSSSSSSSTPSGPLKLNIPFALTAPVTLTRDDSNEQQESMKKITTEQPKNVADDSYSTKKKDDNRHQDAIVTVYELNENDSKFFLRNKSTENSHKNIKSPSTIPDHDVPVAEFIDDAVTNLSGVVDYKIPDKKNRNLTDHLAGTSINQDRLESYDETPTQVEMNSTESDVSPTLILLLSPTKIPFGPIANSDLVVAHNSSLGQVVIRMENSTVNASSEIISVSVPKTDTVTSLSSSDPIPDFEEYSTTDFGTTVDFNDETSSDSTDVYDEENYEESTEEAEEEILKHSEAGMTVTLSPYRDQTTLKPSVTDKEPTESSEISSEVSINGDFVRETTLVDFNESKTTNPTSSSLIDDSEGLEENAKDMEPAVGYFSDDSSIETQREEHTLKSEVPRIDDTHMQNPTSIDISEEASPLKFPTDMLPAKPIDDELRESTIGLKTSTEKIDSVETMIASSTNDAGTIISQEEFKFEGPFSTSKKKTTGQPFRFEQATTRTPYSTSPSVSNVGGMYDYEPSNYPRRNPYGLEEDDAAPVIRTMDEQRYRPQTEQEDQNFFPSQQHYVRFPNYDKHDRPIYDRPNYEQPNHDRPNYDRPNYDRPNHDRPNNDRPNYVRFPSEEANSIHLNDYKERRPYNKQEHNHRRGSSATRNVSVRENLQKQSYWWLPPAWRVDKQQQHRSKSSTERSRTPMLLRFWTKMPLVRDPSLDSKQPAYPSSEVTSRDSGTARHVNYYREISTQDLNRAFARKSRSSAVGG